MNAQTEFTIPELPDDVVVSVQGVSKKFCRNLRRSMWYGIHGLGRNLCGLGLEAPILRPHEFWALKDVGFELRRGQVLGLIGSNGCGKTTLLRLLTGIFPPDQGLIALRGRVGALIALGAGFHPHLTGAENVYVNGAILGLSAAHLRERFADIAQFAGIGEFMDAPVATYSSGMKVRLGFAIAASVDPAILLVDEVIAVGDVDFRKRCLEWIRGYAAGGGSVILVSHYLDQIREACTRAIWLDHGRIAMDADPEACIEAMTAASAEG